MKITQSFPPHTTNALFRTFCSWISTSLAALGWVQVFADTDWATETLPGGGSTALAHYEIWRMGDALHASAPIYMKLEFGTGGTGQAVAGLWTTFAASWDGVSALTGLTSPRMATAQKDWSTTCTWLISGSTNRFEIVASIDVADVEQGMIMAVERTHDGVGADTAAGLLWVGAGCQGGGGADSIGDYKNYYWPWGGTSPGTETIGIFPPTFGSGTDGVTTAVYPVMICKGGPYANPPRCLLGVFASDYALGSTNVVPIYGANVTYYRPAGTTYANASRYAAASAFLPLVRYD